MFSETKSSIPEVSKVIVFARDESIFWQIGSVKSIKCWNMSWIKSWNWYLKQERREASGILEKLQKSRNSLETLRRVRSKESLGTEKIFWIYRSRKEAFKRIKIWHHLEW